MEPDNIENGYVVHTYKSDTANCAISSQVITMHASPGNFVNAISTVILAVYTWSPAAYDALRSFKLLQLPGVHTLKHYIDANLEQAGEVEQRLLEKKTQSDAMVKLPKQQLEEKKLERNCPLPLMQRVNMMFFHLVKGC